MYHICGAGFDFGPHLVDVQQGGGDNLTETGVEAEPRSAPITFPCHFTMARNEHARFRGWAISQHQFLRLFRQKLWNFSIKMPQSQQLRRKMKVQGPRQNRQGGLFLERSQEITSIFQVVIYQMIPHEILQKTLTNGKGLFFPLGFFALLAGEILHTGCPIC